jgi:hypothetical protein
MKKLGLTLFLMVSVGITCFAQSFTLAGDTGPLANGAGVVQSGPSDTLQLITSLTLTNKSGNTLRVMMKKEEIIMLPETSSSICWAGYCYGPEMMVSTEPVVMPPGETISGCFGHFGPHGSRGVSVIRWTFFNESDPADSISLTAQYSTFPAAVGDIRAPQYTFSVASQIPADNQLVVRYSFPPDSHGRIELLNTNGKIVSVSEKRFMSGTDALETTQLPSGIYFCVVRINGKAVIAKKVLVFHGVN